MSMSTIRRVLASLVLLAAVPAADSKSAKSQCTDRCSVNYGLCLKRTTTAKGRSQCKIERKACKGSCETPARH